jgi:nitrogen fixation/metabolism regulation signal transduction histidine kinase
LIALSLVYPLIIANLFDYLIAIMSNDPMAPQVAGLLETRDTILWLLIGMQVLLTAIIFIISIFMSHKIAGPLFKLKRYFKEARDGNISQELRFYEKDYFQDLVPEYNAMMEAIRGRNEKITMAVDKSFHLIKTALKRANPEIRKDLESALKILNEAIPKEQLPNDSRN